MQQIIPNPQAAPLPAKRNLDVRLALRAAAQVEAVFGTRLLLPGLATCRVCSAVMVPWPWLNKGPVYACHNQQCNPGRVSTMAADSAAWRLLQADPTTFQALAPFRRASDILRVLRDHLERVLIDTRPGVPLPIELLWFQTHSRPEGAPRRNWVRV